MLYAILYTMWWQRKKQLKLPAFFKPILWSYDFEQIDPSGESKKTIIVNAVNYGDLDHWRWLERSYGRRIVRQVINSARDGEIRPPAKKLAELLFH